jgi:F-type H+-transporting ATPase subunit gamma
MVSNILNEVEWASDLTTVREVKRIGLVLVTTDRGLCGSLNSNVLKTAQRFINENKNVEIEIIALGKKGNEFFKKRGVKIHSFHGDLTRKGSFSNIQEISNELRGLFLDRQFDRIEVIYPRFQSALVQKPTQFTLLPFVAPKAEKIKSFIYEPGPALLLESLVPMLINFQLYRVVLEANASEHGARMAAMEAATKNAKDMIERLTLERNRARQAAITKELMEIIGGAEALAA